jgi:hypothetical protein
MKNILPVVLLLALSSVPALAQRGQNDQGENNDDQGGKGRTRGAPGPIMGASLPVLLVAGGIYWLVRRRKGASAD